MLQAPALPIDQSDALLLKELQEQVPLVPKPFAEIAQKLYMHEDDVLRRIRALSSPPKPIIRQISAIFDSASLGYQSCLVAARIDEEQIEAAAAMISQHPGVSHNYQRNHTYNLWFTLAVQPDSMLGLERTIEILQRQSGAAAMRPLPSLKMYKIGVKFDLSGDVDVASRTVVASRGSRPRANAFVVSDADKRMIRALQQNLPVVSQPYDVLAGQIGVTPTELLAAAQEYLDRGVMRRFAAVLRHRHAGFSANAMGVWVVPDEQADSFGATTATFDAVSHCYRRPTFPDWPYSIFTMVHGPSREKCEAVLAEISRTTGIGDYAALYSTREFKKVRLKYFTSEIIDWENCHR